MAQKFVLAIFAATAFMATSASAGSIADASAMRAPLASKGRTLLDANGARLAPIMRVTDDGSAQVILQKRVITIPAHTISIVNGMVATNLSKSQAIALR